MWALVQDWKDGGTIKKCPTSEILVLNVNREKNSCTFKPFEPKHENDFKPRVDYGRKIKNGDVAILYIVALGATKDDITDKYENKRKLKLDTSTRKSLGPISIQALKAIPFQKKSEAETLKKQDQLKAKTLQQQSIFAKLAGAKGMEMGTGTITPEQESSVQALSIQNNQDVGVSLKRGNAEITVAATPGKVPRLSNDGEDGASIPTVLVVQQVPQCKGGCDVANELRNKLELAMEQLAVEKATRKSLEATFAKTLETKIAEIPGLVAEQMSKGELKTKITTSDYIPVVVNGQEISKKDIRNIEAEPKFSTRVNMLCDIAFGTSVYKMSLSGPSDKYPYLIKIHSNVPKEIQGLLNTLKWDKTERRKIETQRLKDQKKRGKKKKKTRPARSDDVDKPDQAPDDINLEEKEQNEGSSDSDAEDDQVLISKRMVRRQMCHYTYNEHSKHLLKIGQKKRPIKKKASQEDKKGEGDCSADGKDNQKDIGERRETDDGKGKEGDGQGEDGKGNSDQKGTEGRRKTDDGEGKEGDGEGEDSKGNSDQKSTEGRRKTDEGDGQGEDGKGNSDQKGTEGRRKTDECEGKEGDCEGDEEKTGDWSDEGDEYCILSETVGSHPDELNASMSRLPSMED